MEKRNILKDLVDNYKANKDKYSKEYFYNLGKQLSFIDRVIYDYRINYENFFYNDFFVLSIYEQDFIDKLIENKETSYLIDNFGSILRKKIDADTESIHEEVLMYFKNNVSSLSKEDLYEIFFEISKFIALHNQNESTVLKIEKKILEVTNNDFLSLFDIKFYKDGGYSRIFKLNNYIIKVGNSRACNEIVDNSRILLPYFKNFIGDTYLEITDYCSSKDVSLDDLYSIYEELRNENVLWFDPCARNVGVINEELISKQAERRNNLSNLRIIENPNRKDYEFKNGDYVIFDLDHMVFDDNQEEIKKLRNRLNEDMEQRLDYFERRYNESKKKVLNKKSY